MPNVTFNGNTYSCAVAYKGPDYVHLVDSNGVMIVAFDGVSDFSGFSIANGNWSAPSEKNCCIAVFHEDGTLVRGSKIANSVTLDAKKWNNNSQTVTLTGMTSSKSIVVAPDPGSHTAYGEAGVYCSAQGSNNLTFKCTDVPANNLTVNVLVIGG